MRDVLFNLGGWFSGIDKLNGNFTNGKITSVEFIEEDQAVAYFSLKSQENDVVGAYLRGKESYWSEENGVGYI